MTMVDILSFKCFYPILFLSITVITIAVAIIIGIVKVKSKDNNLFGNIFNKHVDEHIDTTDKFSKAHTEMVEVVEVVDGIPTQYQHELHSIEETVKKETTRLDKLVDDMEEVNQKLDILLEWKFETERNKKA